MRFSCARILASIVATFLVVVCLCSNASADCPNYYYNVSNIDFDDFSAMSLESMVDRGRDFVSDISEAKDLLGIVKDGYEANQVMKEFKALDLYDRKTLKNFMQTSKAKTGIGIFDSIPYLLDGFSEGIDISGSIFDYSNGETSGAEAWREVAQSASVIAGDILDAILRVKGDGAAYGVIGAGAAFCGPAAPLCFGVGVVAYHFTKKILVDFAKDQLNDWLSGCFYRDDNGTCRTRIDSDFGVGAFSDFRDSLKDGDWQSASVSALKSAWGGITGGVEVVGEAVKGIGLNLRDSARGTWNSTKSFVISAWDNVKRVPDAISWSWERVTRLGSVVNGKLRTVLENPRSAFRNACAGCSGGGIATALGYLSPSLKLSCKAFGIFDSIVPGEGGVPIEIKGGGGGGDPRIRLGPGLLNTSPKVRASDLDVNVRVKGNVTTIAPSGTNTVTRIGSTGAGSGEVGGRYSTDIGGSVINQGGQLEINPIQGCAVRRNGVCCIEIHRTHCVLQKYTLRKNRYYCAAGYERDGRVCYRYSDKEHSIR